LRRKLESPLAKNTKKTAAKKAPAKATPAKKPKALAKATKPAAAKVAKAPSKKAARPAATKPAATKPAATKPAATKPAATKPAATKPAATKPAATKPADASTPSPVAAKPAANKTRSPFMKGSKPQKPASASGARPGTLLTPPTPPRSRLSVREPAQADDLKMKIGALATAINQIRAVKRSIQRTFWDIGQILVDVRDRKLYVAKGYGSFEAFVEREIDLGKTISLRLVRAVEIFVREPAVAAGMDRVLSAVAAFDGETEAAAITNTGPVVPNRSAMSTSVGVTRSPIPFHKQ